MSDLHISTKDIEHIATLAKLSISESQKQDFTQQLRSILEHMAKIQQLDTQGVEETHQVTHVTNVYRDDVVIPEKVLSQEAALAMAKKNHNGYFLVEAVLKE